MIIRNNSNINIIQGSSYGDAGGITDWCLENTSTGIFNILNSSSANAKLSIIDNGNVGIGTIPITTSSKLEIIGDVNISGTYRINNRDIISETSNYVLSTSNNIISSSTLKGFWTTYNNMTYYNTSNIGIGTTYPISKLHLYDDINSETKLTIQNNFIDIMPIGGVFTRGTITSSTDKYIFFKSGTSKFKVPNGFNCDILMIGAGGWGSYYCGGGAGALIGAKNQTLPEGDCVVVVGNGVNCTELQAPGEDSSISVNGTIRYCAKGGGYGGGGSAGGDGGCGGGGFTTGGSAVSTNIVVNNSGVIITSGAAEVTGNYTIRCNNGGKGFGTVYGGGGGITNAGSFQGWGYGGNGYYEIPIINYTYYNFKSYFANNTTFGVLFTGAAGEKAYIGGGGGGINTSGEVYQTGGYGGAYIVGQTSTKPGAANTGSGGTGNNIGGSGFVIIRYRVNSTSSSIELIRGANNDSNRDYKIGNYNEDFIIKSSLNGSDTNYITITGSTGAITNPTGTTSWTSASDRRIKENIERASYDKCYESINKLELNRFNYINGFNTINRDITQLGFIAQEVKEIFPKSVFENSYINNTINIPDLHSIDITQINYTLYGTVKKLIEKVNNNKNNIKYLKSILNIDIDTISTSNLILDII